MTRGILSSHSLTYIQTHSVL